MEIKYDMSKNYFKCFNESLGIASNKKKISKQRKVYHYTTYGLIYLILTFIIIIMSVLFKHISGWNSLVSILNFLIIILIILLVIYFLYFFLRAFLSKKRKIKGSFLINEDGLTYTMFNGIKIIFTLDKIESLVIGKHSLVILTDTPIYFFCNNDIKDIAIKNFQKYKKDIVITKL